MALIFEFKHECNIGDIVYCVDYEHEAVTVPCSFCEPYIDSNGETVHLITAANGEQADCKYCYGTGKRTVAHRSRNMVSPALKLIEFRAAVSEDGSMFDVVCEMPSANTTFRIDAHRCFPTEEAAQASAMCHNFVETVGRIVL